MKTPPDEKIRNLARTEAQHLLDVASAAASALAASTAKDISLIQIHLESIDQKLDEKLATKEELSNFIGAILPVQQDHETRIRMLERWGLTAIGGLYVIVIIIGWAIRNK